MITKVEGKGFALICGDALQVLKALPSECVQTCVTSPPYWGLRDYGMDGQLGLEATLDEYVQKLVGIFSEVRRTLKGDGTLWLNLGDSYASSGGKQSPHRNNSGGFSGSDDRRTQPYALSASFERPNALALGMKAKDLVGLPWLVAFALRADGWYLRSEIIWNKRNCMPSSVKDRPTRSHEHIFLFAKSSSYFFDAAAIREDGPTYTRKAGGYSAKGAGIGEGTGGKDGRGALGFQGRDVTTVGRNKRSVWTVSTKPFKGAHFATFPQDLIEPCILAGSRTSNVVLDPFSGAATTGVVSLKHHRRYIGIEIKPEYIDLSLKRMS